jgi:hypothetical protein
MASNKPLWQRGVDALDKVAAPALESVTRHESFGIGVSLLHQTRRLVYSRTERLSRRVLHGMNLPTASDVNRLLTQIAAVEHRVRQLDEQVEARLPESPPRRQRRAAGGTSKGAPRSDKLAP